MARSEARLAVTIWTDDDFLALSARAQRMFMFLLSQPDLGHDGVIALRVRRWSKKAAGLTVAQVIDDLDELARTRFVAMDDDAEELLVRSFIRRDKVYRQPNVLRAAADHMKVVTSPLVLAQLAAELDRIAAGDDIPAASVDILIEMRGTAEKGSGNPSRKGIGNPSGDPSGNPATAATEPSAAADLTEVVSPCLSNSEANPSEPDIEPEPIDVSAGDEGSGNPSGNPSPGTPGERGVVTVVSRASPYPVPRAPGPRPQSSTGGRASARDEPPPERCSQHLDDPDPPPCGRCGNARKRRARWDADQLAADQAARSEAARQRAETLRLAIAACDLCDPGGRLTGGRLCTHDPYQPDRATRGAQQARDILAASRKEAP